jgi:hypothetical protein
MTDLSSDTPSQKTGNSTIEIVNVLTDLISASAQPFTALHIVATR